MQLVIDAVLDLRPGGLVTFSTSAGTGVAAWSAESPPLAGQLHSAELDIDRVLGPRDLMAATSRAYALSTADGITTLTGSIDCIDDDGMAYLRLAPDCLIMLETIGVTLARDAWLTISVPATDVRLTPLSSPF